MLGLFGLFAIGSLGFWLLLCIETLILIALIEFDRVGTATFTMLLTFGILKFFGDFNILSYVLTNPLAFAGWVGAYLGAGVAWSFGKWFFYLNNCKDKIKDIRGEFMRAHGKLSSDVMSPELKLLWAEKCEDRHGYGNALSIKPPQARDHKSRIMTWMMYWPWSMVWTVLSDPIKKIFKRLFNALHDTYQAISNKVFAGLNDDMPSTEELAAAKAAKAEAVRLEKEALAKQEREYEDQRRARGYRQPI